MDKVVLLKSLQSLNINNTKLNKVEISNLFVNLNNLNNLKYLDLTETGLDAVDVIQLSENIHFLKHLTTLKFDNIHTNGICILSPLIKKIHSLINLEDL